MRSGHLDADRQAVLRMGNEARDFIEERGFHLMLWGASLASLYAMDAGQDFDVWQVSGSLREGIYIGALLVATIGSYIFERYHAVNPMNVLSHALMLLWGAVAAGILLVTFLGGVTGIMAAGPRVGSAAALIAVGFCVSSPLILRRAPFWFAAFWWALVVLSFFVLPAEADILGFGGFFGGLFAPGLCLYALHWVRVNQRQTM